MRKLVKVLDWYQRGGKGIELVSESWQMGLTDINGLVTLLDWY